MPDPDLERGWMHQELAEEFPGLGLWLVRVEGGSGRSPEIVRRRLRQLANRITGGHVIHMRQDPVPWAYRVFWRQIGIDPDTDRTPVEQIALDRLRDGGLPSRNLLDDAITIATFETGVPVIAFDADLVGKAIGLRTTGERELLGGGGRPLSSGQIVVADEHNPLALLSGEVAHESGVRRATARMVLGAVQVKGVPLISVEEALWTVADTVTG
ncbi:MAG: phenylalanine--tRNA ligase beta subunit-related protein [Thermoleophilaceae bacterium]